MRRICFLMQNRKGLNHRISMMMLVYTYGTSHINIGQRLIFQRKSVASTSKQHRNGTHFKIESKSCHGLNVGAIQYFLSLFLSLKERWYRLHEVVCMSYWSVSLLKYCHPVEGSLRRVEERSPGPALVVENTNMREESHRDCTSSIRSVFELSARVTQLFPSRRWSFMRFWI